METLGSKVTCHIRLHVKKSELGEGRKNETLASIPGLCPDPQLRSPHPAGGVWPQENSDLPDSSSGDEGRGLSFL